jgi:hypothetical protein
VELSRKTAGSTPPRGHPAGRKPGGTRARPPRKGEGGPPLGSFAENIINMEDVLQPNVRVFSVKRRPVR